MPVEGISAFLMVIKRGLITNSLVNRYEYLHKLRGEDPNAVPIIAIISHFDNSIVDQALVAAEYKEEYEKEGIRFADIIPSCTADLGTVELKVKETIASRRKETRALIFQALNKFSILPGWKPGTSSNLLNSSLMTMGVAAGIGALFIFMKRIVKM